MPKRIGNLYNQIVDFDNIWGAYLDASKGKRFSFEVAQFSSRLEAHLPRIHQELENQSWDSGKARQFVVMEPKRREITAPPFQDRVVHHAVHRICYPIFEKRFIDHSYACIKGKGCQRAVLDLQKQLRKSPTTAYIVQADIKSYFASIDHSILLERIARTIKCKPTLQLWAKIIQAYQFDKIGIPVGALTSQLAANIYLDTLDHILSEKYQLPYFRYMDDFVIVCLDKCQAQEVLEIVRFEVSQLNLILNPKTAIYPIRMGVDWCGYRTWKSHLLPRKRIVKLAKKDLSKIVEMFNNTDQHKAILWQRVCSFLAYAQHCDSFETTKNLLDEIGVFHVYPQLSTVHRRFYL